MKTIRWIFFDIGSTLVDEEEAYHHRIRDMIRGTLITFEQFSEKRVQYARLDAQARRLGKRLCKYTYKDAHC